MSNEVILMVPCHSKEAMNWSGPATAQMIMEGYPSGGCSVLQENVNNEIQTNKAEMMWNADPKGMEKAMENLCPPAGGWSIYHKATPEELMYWVARWMTINAYPVALVKDTDPGEHWVVIKRIRTDVNPTTATTVNLELVEINDPGSISDPVDPAGCTSIVFSGSAWYSQFQSVTLPGSAYNGEYVAVIEPPEVKGRALAVKEVMKGRVITSKEALKYAAKWIKEYKLDEMESYRILKEAKPSKPLLVNEKFGGYYIIPFTTSESAPVAIIVNAYTGGFQEAGAFGTPVKYMSKENAVKTAIKYLREGKPEEAKAELIFKRGKQTSNRYFPLWKVTIDDRVLQINQSGKIFTKELPHVTTKKKVRVILDQIRILDDKDLCIKGKGELVFRSVVTPDNDRKQCQITILPESGVYHVGDIPGENVIKIGKPIFEGWLANSLEIVITGRDVDFFTPDDELRRYRRTFKGNPSDWAGKYFPTDEYKDKEDVGDWEVWYRIEVE